MTRHAVRKRAKPQEWHKKSLAKWQEFGERTKRDRKDQEKIIRRHKERKEEK